MSNWAVRHGLSLGQASISRSVLSGHGTTAQIQAALGIRMHDYRSTDGKVFYAASGTPAMPDEIGASVSGMRGLSSYNQLLPLAITKPAGAPMKTGGPILGLRAADLRSAYGVAPQTPGTAQIAAGAPLFMQLAAQRQEVFVRSGDQGTYGARGRGA